jgi:hypothetical protein
MPPRSRAPTVLALLSSALLACAPLPGQGEPQASEHGVHAQPKGPPRPAAPSPSIAVVPIALAPPTAVPTSPNASIHDSARWHPPGFGHEHGQQPNEYVDNFLKSRPELHQYWGNGVSFDGPWNTSAIENTTKHAGMKIAEISYPAITDQNGGWIHVTWVQHLLSHPMDRQAAKHSTQMFILDAGGGLTVRMGHMRFGGPEAVTPKRCTLSTGGSDCAQYNQAQRPILLAVDQASWDGEAGVRLPIRQETWYGAGAGAATTWGVDPTTFFVPGERVDDHTAHERQATGGTGTLREYELNARAPIYNGARFSGPFWTNQDGTVCSSPADPYCSTNGNVALLQYISPTYEGMKMTRAFPVNNPLPPGGVVLPN